ncbi:hypothetical protein C8Q79DRAFT_929966 [Trametes meyenii]|nr:hypothetical protein C8Q79DRAFT_929966 [Trametes meyenii]
MCLTENELSIAIVADTQVAALRIIITGKAELVANISRTENDTDKRVSGSAHAVVEWAVTLFVDAAHSVISGKLRKLSAPQVTLHGPTQKTTADWEKLVGTGIKNPQQHLEDIFPKTLDINDLFVKAGEQQSSEVEAVWPYFHPGFGGRYRLGTPILSNSGDILFELCHPDEPPVASNSNTVSSAS